MKGLPYSNSRGAAAAAPTVRKVTFPIKNLTVAVAAAAAADGFGTAILGDFPEGNILVLGGIAYLQFLTADADIGATWTGSYGVGTTPTADAVIATTDEDLIVEVALAAATAKLSPVTRGVGLAPALFDNTDGSLELNLNLVIATAAIADGSSADFTANGYVQLVYTVLGDD